MQVVVRFAVMDELFKVAEALTIDGTRYDDKAAIVLCLILSDELLALISWRVLCLIKRSISPNRLWL